MARMHPPRLPPEILADPKRSAERRVFETLERGLDDRTHVFYSVAWLGRAAREGAGMRDGEADFVVAHPTHGALILEVKGGRIARDNAGTWHSIDRKGERHEIKNPFAQARGSKYALLEKIRELPGWSSRYVPMDHAVCLPDCGRTQYSLAPDAPNAIVLFAEDLAAPAAAIERIYVYWRGQSKAVRPLGHDGIEMLMKLLAQSFELRQPLGLALAEADRQILVLTQQQFRVLDMLNRQRRVAVRGGAGTGKSLLAVEKAKRLAGEGMRVLLTCFNRPLADFLRRSVGDVEGLEVGSFHQLCIARAKEAGVAVPDPLGAAINRTVFDEGWPGALATAVEKTGTRYDAIIVDESQDMHESWWLPLEMCLADGGIFYVFYDDNQRVYRRPTTFPDQLVEITLSENMRNTQRIFAAARPYYEGGELRCTGPEGIEVECVTAASPAMIDKEVVRIVDRLTRIEGIAPDDIAVLLGVALDRRRVGREGKLGALRVTQDSDEEPGKVLLDTIHRFKGLERRVVVLAELEELTAEDAAAVLYVGTTRGRTHLAVVATAATLPRIGLTPSVAKLPKAGA